MLAPTPVVFAEGAVLEAIDLFRLVFLPQQVKGDALASQASMDRRPIQYEAAAKLH